MSSLCACSEARAGMKVCDGGKVSERLEWAEEAEGGRKGGGEGSGDPRHVHTCNKTFRIAASVTAILTSTESCMLPCKAIDAISTCNCAFVHSKHLNNKIHENNRRFNIDISILFKIVSCVQT